MNPPAVGQILNLFPIINLIFTGNVNSARSFENKNKTPELKDTIDSLSRYSIVGPIEKTVELFDFGPPTNSSPILSSWAEESPPRNNSTMRMANFISFSNLCQLLLSNQNTPYNLSIPSITVTPCGSSYRSFGHPKITKKTNCPFI